MTISWTIDNGLLRLRWVERGGPTTSAPTTRGFGINLIEQSAKGEGADARMSLQADGLVWEITLPLPRPAAADASQPGSSNVRLVDSVRPRQDEQEPIKTPGKLAGNRLLSRTSRSLPSISPPGWRRRAPRWKDL